MTPIKNMGELRAAVSMLTSNVNNMCNVKTTEEIIDYFIQTKDLLIEIYKFNVEKLNK